MRPPPLLGQVLGSKYRALRVLGEGGMGTVFECEHVQLHRRVAVKVLHPAQARKKASVQRFQNEAHVAGAIGHPNICEIYDMGELEDGSPFLVMELLQGETLAERIASEGALPFDDIVDVISQVLSGLVAAHEKGIIHRDIKPENVFLTSRPGLPPMVKLLDFGISKVAGADDLHLTRTGMVMGTPFYMSPEQARGDRNLDHRVDLYATGVMLYECLTGRRPFHASNYNALLMQILTATPRPPHELRPAVPEAFEAVVKRAMQRDRDKRYASAAEMQRDVAMLRDPGAVRRMQSVPPEPVPLVTPRRKSDDPPTHEPAHAPVELPPIPIDLEGKDLLDSGLQPEASDAEDDSGSLEIPIVTEPPVSARDAIELPLPPNRDGRLYRPDPGLLAARAPRPSPSRAEPPPVLPTPSVAPAPTTPSVRAPSVRPPRPTAQAKPSRARPPAIPPPSQVPPPAVPPKAESAPKPRARAVPAVPPRKKVQPPAPAPVVDAPWLDENVDPDPTEVGSIFLSSALTGARSFTDFPIDVDATEQIPPERLAPLRKLPRVREVQAKNARDPRAEPPAAPAPPDEPVLPEDDAPTTLFTRRAIPPTTERAPAPTPSLGRPPSIAPMHPPPLPRLRGPKDR